MIGFDKFELRGFRVTYVYGVVFISHRRRMNQSLLIRRSVLRDILARVESKEAQQ